MGSALFWPTNNSFLDPSILPLLKGENIAKINIGQVAFVYDRSLFPLFSFTCSGTAAITGQQF
jgi:hypothetical protein